MIKKIVSVVFAEHKLEQRFESLQKGNFQDQELYRHIHKAIQNIKINPACGLKIQKNLWPANYRKSYAITNLWKYNLPHGWRLLYTIKQDEIRIISIILEWFGHKAYEKRFKY